jgi:predicted MFS family arabinose efflux permease
VIDRLIFRGSVIMVSAMLGAVLAGVPAAVLFGEEIGWAAAIGAVVSVCYYWPKMRRFDP